MKIAAIIPSRYSSTRFDGKPLAPILGQPMIQRVYKQARKAASVTDVVVATDDERILTAVQSFGGRAVMTSDENRSGTDRVGEAAGIMGLSEDDLVINIQGDQPAFCPKSLNQVVAPFHDKSELGMSTLAFITKDEDEIKMPKECKVTFDHQGYALYFSRSPIPCARDENTESAFKHLGIYAYTKRFLDIFRNLETGILEDIEKLEQLRALEHGYDIKVVVTPYDSPEVDLPEDIPRIEKYIKEHQDTLDLIQ
jgi:3-deoxy-manno-octulosonate cytidylyltransferase (CMP-KDO synthetase)